MEVADSFISYYLALRVPAREVRVVSHFPRNIGIDTLSLLHGCFFLQIQARVLTWVQLCQMENAKRIVFYHLALQVPARVVRELSYFP